MGFSDSPWPSIRTVTRSLWILVGRNAAEEETVEDTLPKAVLINTEGLGVCVCGVSITCPKWGKSVVSSCPPGLAHPVLAPSPDCLWPPLCSLLQSCEWNVHSEAQGHSLNWRVSPSGKTKDRSRICGSESYAIVGSSLRMRIHSYRLVKLGMKENM